MTLDRTAHASARRSFLSRLAAGAGAFGAAFAGSTAAAAQPAGPPARAFVPARHAEDDWVGGVLSFGDSDDGAAVAVTNRDERCAMVNYDPDTATPSIELLKTLVRERGNRAGIYATVVRRGPLRVGDPIFFEPAGGGTTAG